VATCLRASERQVAGNFHTLTQVSVCTPAVTTTNATWLNIPTFIYHHIRRRNSVFGHIARLSKNTPAHQALRCHVDLTLGHLPDQSWKRRPGRPNNRWIDQLRRDNNNTPPADLWRRSTTRGQRIIVEDCSVTPEDATVLDNYALLTMTTYNSVGHWIVYTRCKLSCWCSASMSDSWLKGRWFDSRPGRYQVN